MESMKIRGQGIITGVKDTGNNFIVGNYDTVKNISQVSFTPAINISLKYLCEFLQKFEMVPMVYLPGGNNVP
jgi:hypothetical protein